MQYRHHDRRIDIGLRAGGALLCGLSCLAVSGLIALRLPQASGEPGAAAFAFAAVAFPCASFGAVLLTLGHHIFDEVETSPRWRRQSPFPEVPPRSPLVIRRAGGPPTLPSYTIFNLESRGAAMSIGAAETAPR